MAKERKRVIAESRGIGVVAAIEMVVVTAAVLTALKFCLGVHLPIWS
jgi:hypothetical protein